MSIEGKMVIERIEHERLVEIEKKYIRLVKQHDRLKTQFEKIKKTLPPAPKKHVAPRQKRPRTRLTDVLG